MPVGGIVGTDVVTGGATGRIGAERPTTDSPPTVIVGVASALSAEEALPVFPRLAANAAVAAPPIIAERMMNFVLEAFLFTTLV